MDTVGVKEYAASNWFTQAGVARKRKEIVKRGLPNVEGCLFMTLTIDPGHGSPKDTYEQGKDRLRRFLAKLRGLLNCKFPWAWKLEFNRIEYAHWHLIIKTRRRIPKSQLVLLNYMWGLGRVNVKKITSSDFDYLFKYVSKVSFDNVDRETGISLPSWVLDYIRHDEDRPRTRIRFWQTGGGFYENPPAETVEKKPKKYSLIPHTLRIVIGIWARKATVVVENSHGRIIASKQIFLRREWFDVLNNLNCKLLERKALYRKRTFYLSSEYIIEEISIWKKQIRRHLNLMCLSKATV